MSEPGEIQATTHRRRLALACAAELGLVLVAMFVAWLFGLPLAKLINPTGRQIEAVLIGVLATAPMVGFFFVLLRSRWRPLARLRRQAERMVATIVGGAPLGLVLALALCAGIGEEVLFRGAVQALLVRWGEGLLGEFGVAGGVLAASLLFGLAHPMSRTYVVIATVGGLYLGGLAQWRGEVLSAMVAHALYDVVALLWLSKRR